MHSHASPEAVNRVSSVPAYSLEIEVDMRAALELRRLLRAAGKSFSYHDLFAKAAATSVQSHKTVNASWTEEGIHCHQSVNVGIAVSVPSGLMVPVIRDAAAKTLSQLAAESSQIIRNAKTGRLTEEDVRDGTITISNLGMYPLSRFQAAIHPPESCILAFGRVQQKLVLENGAPTERPVIYVSATFDHRVVDAAVGASFLSHFKACLENPAIMLY